MGRSPSGKTRQEIERESKRRRRAELEQQGIVTKTYTVKSSTAAAISALKEAHKLNNDGQILDAVFEGKIEP